MAERRLLVPVSGNPPAKVKDPGVVRLVMEGAAAYNAKSGEFLLLPVGEWERRRIAASLRAALFEAAGVQPVDCGSDEGIFSLADRFAREWGDDATAFGEERGRSLYMLGWSRDREEAAARIGAVMDALLGELRKSGGADFRFLEEVQPTEGRAFVLVSPAEAGTLGARPGLRCPACGTYLLPDSPTIFHGAQPGDGEAEEALEEIATPGANTIVELCNQLHIEVTRTLKAMLYVASDGSAKPIPVAAFVRGDCNVSMNKLSGWLYRNRGLAGLRSAERAELEALIGKVAGYCGPVGMPAHVVTVCDESVRRAKNTVAGANRPGYHLKGCCHGRDFDTPMADIAQNAEGTPCSCGAASLEPCLLRDSGAVGIGTDHPMTAVKGDGDTLYKPLSFRTREGVVQYPIQWRGNVSVENLMLGLHSNPG